MTLLLPLVAVKLPDVGPKCRGPNDHYRRARRFSYPDACDEIVSCYEQGLGVRRNKRIARYWRERASAYGTD